MTLRDAILAADDLPREEVATPEWEPAGVPFVYVRGLTSSERDDYETSLLTTGPDGRRVPNPRMKNVRASFAVRVIVDEHGERIFTERDVVALAGKSALVIERLWDVGRRLSGMQTEEELEAEGNPSTGDPDGSVSSDSPTPSVSLTSMS